MSSVPHGGDATVAATMAIRDAVSHCCLCGLHDIFNLDASKIIIDLVICLPFPERVDVEEAKKLIPYGEVNVTVNQGGLKVRGLHVDSLGEGDDIIMANAAITVWIDV